MILKLSDTVQLRPQQLQLWRKVLIDGCQHVVRVAHRRFGKDFEFFALCWAKALTKKAIYVYFLPTISQSRKVIWETIGEDGMSLLDRIPPQCVAKINNSEQKIVLANGSIIYVTGSDNYRRLVGMNIYWGFWSEYQDSDTRSLDAMRPMITRNKGGYFINGSPRAYNQLGEMFHKMLDNPDFYVTNLTCENTYDQHGNPIITPEMIEQERSNGMPEELIQQEYFGNWDACLVGSYYGSILTELKEKGKICDSLCYNPNLVVYTGWDIGWSDNTTVWFAQNHPQLGVVFFDYYENHHQTINHYAEMMNRKRKQYGWTASREINFGPHDIVNGNVGAGNLNVLARECGITFQTTAAPKRKIHGIHLVRFKLPSFNFNASACSLGLKRLSEYRSDFNYKTGVGQTNPVHDLASHGADGMQTFVLGFMYKYEIAIFRQQIEYANLYGIDAAP